MRCLLLLFGLLSGQLFATAGLAQSRVALVIGNSSYSYPAAPLKNPKNDAEDMAAALRKLGFKVVLGIDVGNRQFSELLSRFSSDLLKAEVGLFYYAGHALQYEHVNYLMPVDATVENQFRLKQETVNLADVIDAMEANAPTNLVFLDACRDNPFAERFSRTLTAQGRSAALGRGLAAVKGSGRDTLITFATAAGDVAQDGSERNSPFTEAMLTHIEETGIEIETMLKRVTSDVLRKTNRSQAPERLSRLTTEFYFRMPQATAAPAAPKLASRPPPVECRLPAQAAPQPATGQNVAWVKLCENATINAKDASGKDITQSRGICLTHHERLDGNSGMVLVSAAVREIEGSDKKHLLLMVPLGMSLQPGMRVQIDEQSEPIELKYTSCHAGGCVAEVEADLNLLCRLRTGQKMIAMALDASFKPISFPVPLSGFNATFEGPPMDSQKYAEARKNLMEQIRKRQADLAAEAAKSASGKR